jgi:hypothetical protein
MLAPFVNSNDRDAAADAQLEIFSASRYMSARPLHRQHAAPAATALSGAPMLPMHSTPNPTSFFDIALRALDVLWPQPRSAYVYTTELRASDVQPPQLRSAYAHGTDCRCRYNQRSCVLHSCA